VRRPLLALAVALFGIGVLTGGLAWLLDNPKAPLGASRAERLYFGLCVNCHGADGRGSWHALLFLIRPGDLSDAARLARESDRYLFDIIKYGGAPIGRPGMPAFGATLSDADIEALVIYLRERSVSRRAAGDTAGPVERYYSVSELVFD
jgi:mono/diheme cytochrome c family protein